LHDLRKSAKELRYLFELFGSALPRETVSLVVKDLKGLQDCLGTFQDTQVQQHILSEVGEQVAGRADVPTDTLLAVGGLVERLEQRGGAARADYAERFARFSARDVRRRIETLGRAVRDGR
jgi:CHAD domain-containing protein